MGKRVTGIGGIFFKAKDPTKLAEWYTKHLDIEMEDNYPASTFRWREQDNSERIGATVWSLFPSNTDYFGLNDVQFMINYRVENLDEVLHVLKQEGIEILREAQDTPHGRFAAIKDPEGNGIELWQAPDNY